eukprot:5496890-Pleurochrysis_carterae.AAC.1
MSPAFVVAGMCALECTASLLVLRQSSHAIMRASVAHASGASHVHCSSSLMVRRVMGVGGIIIGE